MKIVWKWILLVGITVLFGNCNNGPSEEALKLAEKGKKAKLLNEPDPEEIRMRNLIKQYEEFIRGKSEELDLPGLAYAIVKDGEVVSVNTYGIRKKGKEALVDEHTVFRLASVSKGFAAVLAGLLVHKGYINWNDKVKAHLPNFRLRSRKQTEALTIRHTLSHTTGLKEYSGTSLITKNLSCTSILRGLKNAVIEAKPAEKFAYQNAIFSAISEIGKSVTNLSYEALLDSMIFNPLGMEDASSGYGAMMANENKGFPHTFSNRRGWNDVNIRKKWYNVGPAAGVNASISDMALWLKAMLGHRPDVIPKNVLNEIFKPHIPINDDSKYYETWAPGLSEAWYGMGWRIFNYKKNRIVYHGGYVRGYRPEMGFCPKEDVGIVFLTNASKNDLSSTCVHAFFEMYFAPSVTS
ncbi:serine hydrolase domain-containing protein [Aureispira anguillae]|uniref:Beta-lactamase family protein n=1 Tax=Aureispira anguillae TaxID=2864201 RepID=A0A915YEI5_9BACT|nr:serine hydrolase domain-containing protein [Aureispira anguillae]BDS11657.1 beta-lactamase family protein [Aureispira anguillae]